MRGILYLLILLSFSGCTESNPPDSQTIIPENGIKIGEQIWMKENLKVKTFRNGDPITESKSAQDWIRLYNEKKPAWTVYLWESNSESLYGIIYNYYALIDSRGIAPNSWRVPTSTDFLNLIEFNGGSNSAPKKIMSKDLWIENPGSNESGFNATPGSEIWIGGTFGIRNEYVGYWTNSNNVEGNPIIFGISSIPSQRVYFNDEEPLNRLINVQRAGFYIRCIKE
jgi:uncharacterized protein (TIGR02145 family)